MYATCDKFNWQAHPARERPLAAVACVLIIVVFSGATFVATGSEGWALLTTLVLCLAMSSFFFPTRYEMSGSGIDAWMPLFRHRHLGWDEVQRIEVGRLAAWVSPYRRRTWREQRRGVHVLFGRHRQHVLERLRREAPAALDHVPGDNPPAGG